MESYECRYCLNKVETNENGCICSFCGRKMHSLPYNRTKELRQELISYFRLAQMKLNEKFQFEEVENLLSNKTFPKYENIYKMAFSKKDSKKYFLFLREIIDSIRKYLLNNMTFKTKISFKFLIEKTRKYDEVLNELLSVIGLVFNKTVLVVPETTVILHYEKKKELVWLISNIINNLELLLIKMNNHVDLYNIDIFYNNIINKFVLKSDDSIEKLKKINFHLVKVNNKKILYDILDNGINDYKEMNNTFWLTIFTLLDVAQPDEKVDYFFDGNEVDIIEEINKIYELRYKKINYEIDLEVNRLFDDELKKTIDLILEKKIYEKLNISKKEFLDVCKAEKELHSLIGLANIKSSIDKIKAYSIVNKDSNDLNIHMCFMGNPGTGKTEVARLIADILYENKILPTNKFIETDRSGLVSSYLGDTVNKTNQIIHKAMGGVLFIDEAYSLAPADSLNDYGHEAVAALIKAMEDYRGKFCVILSGYQIPMIKMLDTNPGFKSRIQFVLDFPDYSRQEMSEIIKLILSNKKYNVSDNVLNKMLDIIDIKRKEKNFANAREARNMIEQLIMIQNSRVMDKNNKIILLDDVNKYIIDNKIKLPTSENDITSSILTPEEELDELIGLTDIKKTIRKIRAYVKKNRNDSCFNMNMCFMGNPGTGKTEVARIISRLLYDAGALPEAKIIETDKSGLIGRYLGETEEKTKLKIESAMGGVLFIDEAYALNDNGYGNQAIEILLKEMEDKRGKFCVILAGYKKEMQELIALNPGFSSRIAFELEFPDFNRDELILICKNTFIKKNYVISYDLVNKIVDIVEFYRGKNNFANARTLRNIIDKIIMNQNLRTIDIVDNLIIDTDVLEFVRDNKLEICVNNELIDLESLYKEYCLFDISVIDKNYLEQTVVSISGNGDEGTGFIISKSGICLTCNHCIKGERKNQKVRIIYNVGKKKIKTFSSFKVVFKDEINDFALIQLDEDNEYDYLPLETIEYKYEPLNEFIMAGYPFGGETFSNLSITDGKIASENIYDGRNVVFANMFGKPGNSGSPILDKKTNKVIGVFWGGITYGSEMIPCFTSIKTIIDIIKKWRQV